MFPNSTDIMLDNEIYELTKEGVQPSHRNVDRAAIA